MKEVLFVSFSGGRTSAYMCHWLINNKSDDYELIFVFANTGQEHEKTLEFVDRCDKEMGLNLVWVEAVVNPIKNKGTTHKIVNFDTACRDGRLFEDMIKIFGIPNAGFPHCNRELKLRPIKSYKNSLGFSREHLMAIGIRSDEADRMSFKALEKGELTYPLIKWTQTTKAEVRHWWLTQDYDLDLPEHLGNCVTCWKKSDRKLMTIAKHEPIRFAVFDKLEQKYRHLDIEGQNVSDRVFFRKYRTARNIVGSAQEPFVEFVDHMPELQLTMGFDVDDLDRESDCSSGCELQ